MFKWLLLLIFSCTAIAEEKEIDITTISEALGHLIGKKIEHLGLNFDQDAIAKGLKEEVKGNPSPLNEKECIQAIKTLQKKIIESSTDAELKQTDVISNGEILDDENYPVSTQNSSKHR